MPRRKDGRGRARELTPAWKELVRKRMAEEGLTDAELARRIGASKSTIGKILGEESETSDFVDAICEVLGAPLPCIPRPDDEFLAWASTLTPKEQRKVMSIVRVMREENDGPL